MTFLHLESYVFPFFSFFPCHGRLEMLNKKEWEISEGAILHAKREGRQDLEDQQKGLSPIQERVHRMTVCSTGSDYLINSLSRDL